MTKKTAFGNAKKKSFGHYITLNGPTETRGGCFVGLRSLFSFGFAAGERAKSKTEHVARPSVRPAYGISLAIARNPHTRPQPSAVGLSLVPIGLRFLLAARS